MVRSLFLCLCLNRIGLSLNLPNNKVASRFAVKVVDLQRSATNSTDKQLFVISGRKYDTFTTKQKSQPRKDWLKEFSELNLPRIAIQYNKSIVILLVLDYLHLQKHKSPSQEGVLVTQERELVSLTCRGLRCNPFGFNWRHLGIVKVNSTLHSVCSIVLCYTEQLSSPAP